MTATPSIPLPPRTGRYGVDIFNAVVALVRNRTGREFTTVFNRCLAANRDLFDSSYSNLDGAMNFGLLLNRVEKTTALSAVRSTELAVDKIGLLTNRLIPSLAGEPTARQWDILHRATEMLEKEGTPLRLFNRAGEKDDGVSAADWKAACSRAADVFRLIDSQTTEDGRRKIDLAKRFADKPPRMICAVFRSLIQSMMNEQKLSLREAFDRLKETEPVFWTMSMLSFDKEEG